MQTLQPPPPLILLVRMSLLSGPAWPALVDLSLSVPGSLTYANSYSSASTTPFFDDYRFSVPDATIDGVAIALNLSNLLGIDGLQGQLFSVNQTGNTGALLAWSTTDHLNIAGTTGTAAIISPIELLAGEYILEISGQVKGLAGGSYSGVLNAAPVPLPPASFLFGAGLLGMLGIARRTRFKG